MSNDTALDFTGERVVIGRTPRRIEQDHLARYEFAGRLVRQRDAPRVVDVGCGTGYGTALLQAAGGRPIGIDHARNAIEYARQRYPPVEFHIGAAHELPLASDSIDVATCFELIEHVRDPGSVLSEIGRVLTPDGLLVLSSPNRVVTSPRDRQNPFHVQEFTVNELCSLLSSRFHIHEVYGQRLRRTWWYSRPFSTALWPIRDRYGASWGSAEPRRLVKGLAPRYVVAVAQKKARDAQDRASGASAG